MISCIDTVFKSGLKHNAEQHTIITTATKTTSTTITKTDKTKISKEAKKTKNDSKPTDLKKHKPKKKTVSLMIFTYPTVLTLVHQSVSQSASQTIRPLVHQSARLFIYPSVCPSVRPLISAI